MEELIKIGLIDNFNHLREIKTDIIKKLDTDDNCENEIDELFMIINSLNDTRNSLMHFKK